MMKKKQKSFFSFLVSRSLLFITLALALLILVLSIIASQLILEANRRQYQILVKSLAFETSAELRSSAGMVRVIAQYYQGEMISWSLEDRNNYFQSVLNNLQHYTALWVLDSRNKRVLYTYPENPDALNFDLSGDSNFQNLEPYKISWSDIGINPFFIGNTIAASVKTEDFIVTGWFDPASLTRLITSEQWTESLFPFICDSEGRAVAHPKTELVDRRENMRIIPAVEEALKGQYSSSLGQLTSVDPTPYLYSAAPVGQAGWVVGVAHDYSEIMENFETIAINALSILIISALIVYYGSRKAISKMNKALLALTDGSEAISKGEYNAHLPKQEFREFQILKRALEKTAKAVQDREADLENQVQERTANLAEALENLNKTQEKMIQKEKLSALGQLAAGLAHELNTPLGATASTISLLSDFVSQGVFTLYQDLSQLSGEDREIYDYFLSRQDLQPVLFQNEDRSKMKALQNRLRNLNPDRPENTMVARRLFDLGILEINPDMEGKLRSPHILKILDMVEEMQMKRQACQIIQDATEKSVNVVRALQNYLKNSSDQMEETINIRQSVESVLTLMHSQLKRKIKVEEEMENLFVTGNYNQISQVWLNIIKNAAQAMNYKGTIKISAYSQDDSVMVEIQNNGPPIPPEIRTKIFEPFFTTKDSSAGMGLGLDICRKIVENHKGTISFDTNEERTVFYVKLPREKEN